MTYLMKWRYNPESSGRESRTLRIIIFELATGKTIQVLYQLENIDNVVSEIVAKSNTEMYVLERDGNFPLAGQPTSSFKRVYKIDLKGATNVSDPLNRATGKLFNGKTLEELQDNLASAGITPVSKVLAVDIIAQFPGYSHDKPEGMCLIDCNTLAISNDDDFGIIDEGNGGFVPKYLPFFNKPHIDFGQVYFVNVGQ